MPVAMMARYMANSREGHLECVLEIFAYLKAHPRSSLVLDNTVPEFDPDKFNDAAD